MYTLPNDDSFCGWSADLEPLPEARTLDRDERADCVVVGAGFTGVAAAHRLAELWPEWRVLVLEAQRVGSGASSRNAGFVVDLVEATSRLEPEDQVRYVRLARAGVEYLRRVVREGGLDCGWDESGWMRAAASAEGIRALERFLPCVEAHEVPYEVLEADALEAITGSTFYRYGMGFPGAPQVQPAALVRGLAARLPESIELYEKTPVVELEPGPPILLRTPRGSVTADRVLLATNGYSPGLGFLARKITPLFAFASLTRKLSVEEQERLGGEKSWGMLCLDPMGATVRRTPDQRLFLRNSLFYNKRLRVEEAKREWARANHQRGFQNRFPRLGEVEIEFTWSGLLGSTDNYQMFFGEIGKGLYAAGGYAGAGIAMGVGAGRRLGELAAGVDSDLVADQLALPGPAPLLPEPFRSLKRRWIVRRKNRLAGKFL